MTGNLVVEPIFGLDGFRRDAKTAVLRAESTKAQRTHAFTALFDARPSTAAVERAKALYLARSGATRL